MWVYVACVAAFVMAAHSIRRARRIWSDPQAFEAALREAGPTPWPVMRRDVQRGFIPLAIGISSLSVFFAAHAYAEWRGVRGDAPVAVVVVQTACLLVLLVAVALEYSIAWFGRPAALVPPHVRHEPARWRRRRATGR
jgi:hypothetical protein